MKKVAREKAPHLRIVGGTASRVRSLENIIEQAVTLFSEDPVPGGPSPEQVLRGAQLWSSCECASPTSNPCSYRHRAGQALMVNMRLDRFNDLCNQTRILLREKSIRFDDSIEVLVDLLFCTVLQAQAVGECMNREERFRDGRGKVNIGPSVAEVLRQVRTSAKPDVVDRKPRLVYTVSHTTTPSAASCVLCDETALKGWLVGSNCQRRYYRWKEKNPNGTLEDYCRGRRLVESQRHELCSRKNCSSPRAWPNAIHCKSDDAVFRRAKKANPTLTLVEFNCRPKRSPPRKK